MATLNDILTYSRQLSQTDTNGISDTLGTAFANDAMENMTRTLIERGVDAASIAEDYLTLTVSDNPIGQFSWPSDMFALKTVEIDYSGVGGQNYLQATPLNVANIQFTSWDWLRANQPTNSPLFGNRGKTGEVFPSPTQNALIRIFSFIKPTEFTSTSDTVPYPLSLDYRAIAARVSALYSLSLEEITQMQACQAEYERRLNDIVKILMPPSQQPIQAIPIQISGWQF